MRGHKAYLREKQGCKRIWAFNFTHPFHSMPYKKRLRHLDLWDIRNHDPPQKGSDYILEPVCTELTVAGSDIVKLPENRSD